MKTHSLINAHRSDIHRMHQDTSYPDLFAGVNDSKGLEYPPYAVHFGCRPEDVAHREVNVRQPHAMHQKADDLAERGNAAAGCASSPASRRRRSLNGFSSTLAATPSPSILRIRAAHVLA
jgi:hypothetical protein